MRLSRQALLGVAVAAACATPSESPVAPAGAGTEPRPPPTPHLARLKASAAPTSGAPGASASGASPAAGRPSVELPSYEVVGETASPDGKSWCILDVRLQTPASDGTLRALWTAIRGKQATEWGRFTCRFSLGGGAPSADVNEFMVFGAPPAPSERPFEPLVETKLSRVMFMSLQRSGGRFCVLGYGQEEIVLPVDAGDVSIRETDDGLEIRYRDPVDGRCVTVLAPRPPPPPGCLGAYLR